MEKALLRALLTPWGLLKRAQDRADGTRVIELQEEIKCLPWAEVWDEYCAREKVSKESEWYNKVMNYEKKVTSKRK